MSWTTVNLAATSKNGVKANITNVSNTQAKINDDCKAFCKYCPISACRGEINTISAGFNNVANRPTCKLMTKISNTNGLAYQISAWGERALR
jgi:tRNA A37 methylthiotransferase MiaB